MTRRFALMIVVALVGTFLVAGTTRAMPVDPTDQDAWRATWWYSFNEDRPNVEGVGSVIGWERSWRDGMCIGWVHRGPWSTGDERLISARWVVLDGDRATMRAYGRSETVALAKQAATSALQSHCR